MKFNARKFISAKSIYHRKVTTISKQPCGASNHWKMPARKLPMIGNFRAPAFECELRLRFLDRENLDDRGHARVKSAFDNRPFDFHGALEK